MAKKKVATRKPGQPTKLDETLRTVALNLYKKGKTDKEVAEICGVSEASINNYKKADPDFFKSIKEAKRDYDEEVVNKLRETALGYEMEVEELKTVSIGDGMSQVERHKVVKKFKPDVAAAKFWLTNRKSGEWKERQSVEHSGSIAKDLTDEEIEERLRVLREGK